MYISEHWPSGPGAPLQGAKVTNRISGESEPLMRRAVETLSVRMSTINSDEHSAKQ